MNPGASLIARGLIELLPDTAQKEITSVTNVQVRLIASAIALIAGALAASTDNLDVNVGFAIIVVSGAIFLAEYIRCQRE